MSKEKPNLKMKCALTSEDNGKTWTVERIDYLTSAKDAYAERDFESSTEFQNTTLENKNQCKL